MAALIGVSFLLSWLSGTPTRLPGAALGSGLVLHLEKGALIFALLLLLFVLLLQAYHGRLPLEMRGYKFGSLRETKEQNDASVVELRQTVELLKSHGAATRLRVRALEETQLLLEEKARRR